MEKRERRKGKERDKDERWHLGIETREGLQGAAMTEFKGTSLAFGERTAQLLPWDGSIIAMVTWDRVHMIVVGNRLQECVYVALCFAAILS